MNRYLVTTATRPDSTIEADDFDTVNGLIIFRDAAGRATVAIALEDGLRVDVVEYGDDPRFALRTRLAELRTVTDVESMEKAIRDLENPEPTKPPTKAAGNREQRRRN